MKKLFFSLFFLLVLTVPAAAGFQVDQVSADAVVSENGRTTVTERIQLTFDEPETRVTIPLPDGDLSHISGEDYRCRVNKTDAGVDVVFSSSGGFSGTQTFTVRYTVAAPSDAAAEEIRYALGILSSRWEKDVGLCSFQISLPASRTALPEDFVLSPQVLSGYYGTLSQEESQLTVSGNLLSGSARERMAYDSISVEMTLPGGYFTVRRAAIPVVSVTYVSLVMLGIALLCFLYWRLKLRTPRQSISLRFLPPGGLLPCQLPQALDGASCDLAALMLEWANLGYLSIQITPGGTVALTRGIAMGSERSRAEQRLYRQIFAGKRRVAATPKRFSGAAAQFRAASRRSLNRVIFDRTGGNVVFVQIPCRVLLAVSIGYMAARLLPEGAGFTVLAVLIGILGFAYSIYFHSCLAAWRALRRFAPITGLVLALAAVLLGLGLVSGAVLEVGIGLLACGFSALATSSGPRRSQRGRDLMAEAKGCRMLYHQISWQRLQVLVGQNNRFYQRQLPMAVALGADRALAKRCERLPVPQPEWITGIRLREFSAKELRRQLKPVIKALRAAFE